MNPQSPCGAGFAIVDNRLRLGGIDAERLALRAGATPLFVYARAAIDANLARLRAALPGEIGLHYSLKANPMPALVQHLAGRIDGFDVASAGELATALDTPCPAAAIGFAGPGKTRHELSMAIAAGVVIHLESRRQLQLALELGEALGMTPRATLRVNPDFALRRAGMRMGGGASPFGIDAEEVPALLRLMAGAGVDFAGFHIYSGSQSLDAQALAEAQRATIELALRLAAHAPCAPRLLNLGGGFGIPYFPGERELDLAPIAAGLRARLPMLHSALPELRVVLELGRYLVGNAGVYLARVLERKLSRGQVFLITDGGMHHQLAASGNLGQKIRRNYPVAIANRMRDADCEVQSVVGPLCTPLDLLADRVSLPRAQAGDLIAVFQSGAYGLSASPQAFLGHPPPPELLV